MPAKPPPERLSRQTLSVDARKMGIVLKVRGLKTLGLRCRLARPLFILAAAVAGLPVEIEVTTDKEASDPRPHRADPPPPAKDD